jgi:predicted small lipoprotein YifL
MLNHHLRFLVCTLLLLAAVACGRKGPLYLPDDVRQPPPEKTTTPVP